MTMHIMTKLTLGLGAVLFVISGIAFAIGGTEIDSALDRDGVGEVYWTGNSPAQFSGEFNWDSNYYVFIEEGRSVSVEVLDGDEYNRFIPCEEDNSCDYFYQPGYTYVGDIYVEQGTWEIEFSGDVVGGSDIMILEDKIPVDGLLGLSVGCCGICGALFLLIVGGVMALTLKDQPKVQTSIQFDNDLVVVNENPEDSEYDQDDSA